MRESNGGGDQIGEKCHAGMRLKELGVVRKKGGMKNFEDAGCVDFSVFGGGVIALNGDGGDGER